MAAIIGIRSKQHGVNESIGEEKQHRVSTSMAWRKRRVARAPLDAALLAAAWRRRRIMRIA